MYCKCKLKSKGLRQTRENHFGSQDNHGHIFSTGEEWGYTGWEMSSPDDPSSDSPVEYWWNPNCPRKNDAMFKWNDVSISWSRPFICKSFLS